MRNITVSVSDETYRQARVWAAQRDTSVSAVVQYLLQTLPGVTRAVRAFPVRNHNAVNTFPLPNPVPEANSPDPQRPSSILTRETVEPCPTDSK
jgi:hypothetical protein